MVITLDKALRSQDADTLLDILYREDHEGLEEHRSLVESLLDHPEDLVRLAAVQVLRNFDESVEALRARLDHEQSDLVLAEILDALGDYRDVESLPRMYALANDHPEPLVRSYAALVLGDFPEEPDLEAFLQDRLQTETESSVRCTIAYTLTHLGHEEVVAELVACIRSDEPKVRSQVVSLLASDCPVVGREILGRELRSLAERETVISKAEIRQAIEALDSP